MNSYFSHGLTHGMQEKSAILSDIRMAVQSIGAMRPVAGVARSIAKEKAVDSSARLGASAINRARSAKNPHIASAGEQAGLTVDRAANQGTSFSHAAMQRGLESEKPLVRAATSMGVDTLGAERMRVMNPDMSGISYGGSGGVSPTALMAASAIETAGVPAAKAGKKGVRNFLAGIALSADSLRSPAVRTARNQLSTGPAITRTL